MFELFHLFKGIVVSLYILTSSSVLILSYDHILSFINIYF